MFQYFILFMYISKKVAVLWKTIFAPEHKMYRPTLFKGLAKRFAMLVLIMFCMLTTRNGGNEKLKSLIIFFYFYKARAWYLSWCLTNFVRPIWLLCLKGYIKPFGVFISNMHEYLLIQPSIHQPCSMMFKMLPVDRHGRLFFNSIHYEAIFDCKNHTNDPYKCILWPRPVQDSNYGG